MEKRGLLRILSDSPIVAAVKDVTALEKCLANECGVVFILGGSICNIGHLVSRIKTAGKAAFVHLDLIEGLAAHEEAVNFIRHTTGADGIISTRPNIIKYSKNLGLLTVQRFFILDSISLNNVHKQISLGNADFIEILPGIMPKVIKKLVSQTPVPIISGGLISDKDDILSALNAGAIAISSTNQQVWSM